VTAGNEISENISNVLKLYRCLRKTDGAHPRQMVSCDTGGVGTVTALSTRHRLKASITWSWGSPPAWRSMTSRCRSRPRD